MVFLFTHKVVYVTVLGILVLNCFTTEFGTNAQPLAQNEGTYISFFFNFRDLDTIRVSVYNLLLQLLSLLALFVRQFCFQKCF